MGEWEDGRHSAMGSVLGENPNPKGGIPVAEPLPPGKSLQGVSVGGIVVYLPQPR